MRLELTGTEAWPDEARLKFSKVKSRKITQYLGMFCAA